LAAWLLLASAAPGSDCQLSTGPNGICAAVRLDPNLVQLQPGSSIRIQVNGLNCVGALDCVDCNQRRLLLRWRSSAPDVAVIDSTGAVRAGRPGRAVVRLETDAVTPQLVASAQVLVGAP
jgi:hypothetical protein